MANGGLSSGTTSVSAWVCGESTSGIRVVASDLADLWDIRARRSRVRGLLSQPKRRSCHRQCLRFTHRSIDARFSRLLSQGSVRGRMLPDFDSSAMLAVAVPRNLPVQGMVFACRRYSRESCSRRDRLARHRRWSFRHEGLEVLRKRGIESLGWNFKKAFVVGDRRFMPPPRQWRVPRERDGICLPTSHSFGFVAYRRFVTPTR